MSSTPPDPTPQDDAKAEARKKLVGRLFVIGLGLLIAIYLVPMFLSLRK